MFDGLLCFLCKISYWYFKNYLFVNNGCFGFSGFLSCCFCSLWSEALGRGLCTTITFMWFIFRWWRKQILWSKRCKDEALRGTVKETITQVSRSKKWESKPLLDENGNPKLNEKGKKDFEGRPTVCCRMTFLISCERRIYRCGAWRAWQYRGTSDGDTV